MAVRLSTVFVCLLIAWSFCFDSVVSVAPSYKSTVQAIIRRATPRGAVMAIMRPAALSKKPSPVQRQTKVSNISNRNGLSFDPCKADTDCQNPRICLERLTAAPCTGTTGDCVCVWVAYGQCENSDRCPSGEICAKVPVEDVSICVSKAAAERLGFEEEGVCIAAKHLTHFKPEDLVFSTHAMTTVLCDRAGSCATPGHMVQWNGSGMMMKTYCEEVGCVKKRMAVNSPKYKTGLRVNSETKGLYYTALAARYETVAEEKAMTVAIRAGF